MTTTLTAAVAEYVGRCIEHLRDLPDDARTEMADDIRQIVHEVSAELEGRPEDLLGPPDRFVGELRSAAGLGASTATRRAPSSSVPAWVARVWRARERFDAQAIVTWLRDRAAELRPAGWVLRGYALGAAISFGLSAVAELSWLFALVPVPHLGGSSAMGGLLTAALIFASVEVGRRRLQGWKRAAVIAVSLLSVLALASAVDALRMSRGPSLGLSHADVPVTTMIWTEPVDGTLPTTTIAFDAQRPDLASLMDTSGQIIYVASIEAANEAWYALTDGSLLEPVVVQYQGYSAAVSSPDQLAAVLSTWGFDD